MFTSASNMPKKISSPDFRSRGDDGSKIKMLIPAFDIRTNYASDVIKGVIDETSSVDSNNDNLREGKLMLSISVQSLEKELTLPQTLPCFLEQIVRPISTATQEFPFQDVTAEEDSGEESSSDSNSLTETIQFPIHVCTYFHLKPSSLILSCEPISRSQCVIGIPDVRMACSFSLFSLKQKDSSMSNDQQEEVSVFNDFSLTGCLSSFYVSLLSPQVFAKKTALSPIKESKEVITLRLGLASVHICRKSFLAQTGEAIHDKQYISSKLYTKST